MDGFCHAFSFRLFIPHNVACVLAGAIRSIGVHFVPVANTIFHSLIDVLLAIFGRQLFPVFPDDFPKVFKTHVRATLLKLQAFLLEEYIVRRQRPFREPCRFLLSAGAASLPFEFDASLTDGGPVRDNFASVVGE